MLQELLTMLPKELGPAALVIAIAGAALGLGLWLIGARFSRGLVTLLAVAGGTLAGKELPGWFDWPVTSMGCAVGGAVVLGVMGFVLHRVFIGAALGVLLAWWTGLATWVLLNDGQAWAWPAIESDETTLAMFATELWRSLPEAVARLLPFTCGTALLSGMMVAVLWPRVAVVLTWSLAGISLVMSLGLAAVEQGNSKWLEMLPAETWAQLTTFLALVAFGALVQWRLSPAKAKPAPAPRTEWDRDEM